MTETTPRATIPFMPRTPRIAPGGMVFHVLNRANARHRIFEHADDYSAFERAMSDTAERTAMRILSYCIMPNHWHMVLWPRRKGDLGAFMQRLTTTHVRRWHLYRDSVGMGHLYQGTYKSFPVEQDEHLLAVFRYVERNALRAELVDRAERWRWCSLWRSRHPAHTDGPPLCAWPIPQPRDWLRRVNLALTERELEAIRLSATRGRPFGTPEWQKKTAKRLGLESTFRQRGRPGKQP
ncbi:MAG: transposase [Pirellulales bacterium]